ncbi:hypothetical protein AB6E88_05205 [Providencia hangzhouensis]
MLPIQASGIDVIKGIVSLLDLATKPQYASYGLAIILPSLNFADIGNLRWFFIRLTTFASSSLFQPLSAAKALLDTAIIEMASTTENNLLI